MRNVVTSLWNAPLTWKNSLGLTTATCVLLVATDGLGGRVFERMTAVALILVFFTVLARLAENDARRKAAQVEPATHGSWGRPPSLLFPWWARVLAVSAALGAGALVWNMTDSGAWAVAVSAAAIALGKVVERVVVSARVRRGSSI